MHQPRLTTSIPASNTSAPDANASAKRICAAMMASRPRTRRTPFDRLPEVSLMTTESFPVPKGSPTTIRRQNSTVAQTKGTHPSTKTNVSSGVIPLGSNCGGRVDMAARDAAATSSAFAGARGHSSEEGQSGCHELRRQLRNRAIREQSSKR